MQSTSTITRPPATSTTASAGGSEPRQCWECLRRRWVCDAARPVCNKCRAAGIVCPGYNDQKPLTWLAPGRVTSRTRRQQSNRRNRPSSPPAKSAPAAKKAPPRNGTGGRACRLRKDGGEPTKTAHEEHSAPQTCESRAVVPAGAAGAVEAVPEVSSTFRLRTDTCDVADAIQYYNSHVYPTLVSSQLAPNPFVVPVVGIHSYPNSMRHALVSMALSHRILQLRQDQSPRNSKSPSPTSPASSGSGSPQPHDLGPTSSLIEDSAALGPLVTTGATGITSSSSFSTMSCRLHHHTGLAIRALNEEIDKEATRSSDATITSVLVFLVAELQQSVSPNWRPHVDGLMTLIMLRGGLGRLIESATHLRPVLLSFTIVAVIANTTSPPSDQIAAGTHLQLIDTISDLFSIGVFPSLPCPQALFLDIIRINHLRCQATASLAPPAGDATKTSALAILNRIDTFDAASWLPCSAEAPHAKEGILIAQIYQSSAALFAFSSLQWAVNHPSAALSNPNMPPSASIRTMRSHHRARLFALLGTAMESPVVKKTVAWPLVVAGVAAAAGTQEEREFVEHHLSEMSRDTGNSSPLVAIDMLERFWASGRTEWDDCFDRPYAILT